MVACSTSFTNCQDIIMATSFYVTLPSNGSMNIYPENTITGYKNRLIRSLQLNGEWEVGVSSMSYPRSWSQICQATSKVSYTTENPTRYESDNVGMPTYDYSEATWTVVELSNMYKITPGALNSQMFLPEVLRDKIDIGYSEITGKVALVSDEYYSFKFEGKICTTLGLVNGTIVTEDPFDAPYLMNPHNISHLFVYTDIIPSQLVGGTEAPLIKTIPVRNDTIGTDGESYTNIEYYPVNKNPIDTIEIIIRDGTGKKIPFSEGRSIVTLHFRQRRSTYL